MTMSVSGVSTSAVDVSIAASARRSQEAAALRAADAAALAQRKAAADDSRKAALEAADLRKAAVADQARQVALLERTQQVDDTRSTSAALQSRTSINRVDLYL